MTERNIFGELLQGMQELRDYQEGNIILKSHSVARRPPATLTPERGTVPYLAECPACDTLPHGEATPREA